jgi:hypothetical protein
MTSSSVRPQDPTVSMNVRCSTSNCVSDKNSADARMPCNGERNSCEMFEMNMPLARSAMMTRFFKTCDKT